MLDDGYDPTGKGDAGDLEVLAHADSLVPSGPLDAFGESGRAPKELCHACDAVIVGEPESRGLLVFPRGDDVEYEEPALCRRCSHAIGVTALFRLFVEDEG